LSVADVRRASAVEVDPDQVAQNFGSIPEEPTPGEERLSRTGPLEKPFAAIMLCPADILLTDLRPLSSKGRDGTRSKGTIPFV
jgi:hypothetical protein